MDNRDWTDLGNDIRDVIDSAVNSQDFRKLNDNIRRTVTDGLDTISRNVRNGLNGAIPPFQNQGKQWGPPNDDGCQGHNHHNGVPDGQGQANGYGTNPNGSGAYEAGGPNTGGAYNRSQPYGGRIFPNSQGHPYAAGQQNTVEPQYGRNASPGREWNHTQQQRPVPRTNGQVQAGFDRWTAGRRGNPSPALYTACTGRQVAGTVLMAAGYTMTGLTGLAFILNLIAAAFSGVITSAAVPLILELVFIGVFGLMALRGTSIVARVRRFKKYVGTLKNRTYCTIQELSEASGRTENYVRSDLKKLIRKNWFKQGHLDLQGTSLIVSDETYRQYMETMKTMEDRKKEQAKIEQSKQQKLERENADNKGLSKEVLTMIENGNDYIRQIKESGEAISGSEISSKISRMQLIVEKIFQRVKEHPESASELQKFMSYYLPTTVKLLDAYEELDRQPVQGENILNSKNEIEKTLDTLNQAFEKLLDSLFEETAWDVASDISVLQTILAQEGLTEQEIKANS